MIHTLLDFLRSLTNPDQLIALLTTILSGWVGYAVLFAVVFAETGLLLGFFLPGDSLLFTVGVVAGAGRLNLALVNMLLIAAAILGDTAGYYLGRHAGPRIFNRPDTRWFRREHLLRTQEFYQRYGAKTIVYARFVPIIRTFAPFVAGVARMKYGYFVSFNVFGGIGWVALMTILGFELGRVPLVRQYFDKIILLIIVVSLLPTVIEIAKARRRKAAVAAVGDLEAQK
jgi:membrane-associated protein